MNLVPARSFTVADVCAAAGITYRQLDHWTRCGRFPFATDSLRPGSGHPREFTPADVAAVTFFAELVRAGLTHDTAGRLLTEHLRTGEHVLALSPTVTVRVRRPEDDDALTLTDRALTVVPS